MPFLLPDEKGNFIGYTDVALRELNVQLMMNGGITSPKPLERKISAPASQPPIIAAAISIPSIHALYILPTPHSLYNYPNIL